MKNTSFSLQKYNSFGLDIYAESFYSIDSIEKLYSILEQIDLSKPYLVLGGGTNVLFLQDFNGTVLHNQLKGISIINETENSVIIRAMSGEAWDTLVEYTVNINLSGLENLSYIPGTVGAAPIQNIGAYGSELKDVLLSINAIEISTGKTYTFSLENCNPGYRNSIFKTTAKGQFFILSIDIILNKVFIPNLTYKPVKDRIDQLNIKEPGLSDIRNIIIDIRKSKLPDPSKLGNAGSFFKNPVISYIQYLELSSIYKDMPIYKIDDKNVKVPAAYLIEKSGWKGRSIGNVGVYKNQPLVLVNYGNAKPVEILELSKKIQNDIFNKFNILLEPEVNFI